MLRKRDDRLSLDEQITLAGEARNGGFWILRRFRRVFHPDRVLALLHRVDDHDRHLTSQQRGWEHELNLERERLIEANAKLDRARALLPTWRARTPGVNNGWAAELEEVVGAPERTPVASVPPSEDLPS